MTDNAEALIWFVVLYFTVIGVPWSLRRGGILDRIFPGYFWEKKDVDHAPFPIKVNKDCISKNPERMCRRCDCWKYTRQMCG
jgi:hypothetical protein